MIFRSLSHAREIFISVRYGSLRASPVFSSILIYVQRSKPEFREIKISGGHSGHFVKKLLGSKNQETGDALFVFKSMLNMLILPSDWASHP